jgi:hypothetical protein
MLLLYEPHGGELVDGTASLTVSVMLSIRLPQEVENLIEHIDDKRRGST